MCSHTKYIRYPLSLTSFRSISAKLPSYTGVKWCRFAHDLQSKDKQVGFGDFVKFVKQEAELANDPVFSPDALKRERRKASTKESTGDTQKRQAKNVNKSSHSFATSGLPSKPSDSYRSAVSQRQDPTCAMCKGKHSLLKCQDFAKATVDKRHETVKTNRLCFRCLKRNHLLSNCVAKSSCEECGKCSHHTLLHGATVTPKLPKNEGKQLVDPKQTPCATTAVESAQSKATSVVHSSTSAARTTTCIILPVILYHKDKTDIQVKTYALLDDASDTTFVTTSIKEQLGIEGIETNLNLSTMHSR